MYQQQKVVRKDELIVDRLENMKKQTIQVRLIAENFATNELDD